MKNEILSKDQIKSSDRDNIKVYILNSNIFPLIRQRPFNKVADPNTAPRDIFISGYNTAPLAVDLHKIIEDNKDAFQLGLTVLSRLTITSLPNTKNQSILMIQLSKQFLDHILLEMLESRFTTQNL